MTLKQMSSWISMRELAIVMAFVALHAPSAASAACQQWDMNGRNEIRQSNGFKVTVDLKPGPISAGRSFSGTAKYRIKNGVMQGNVFGTIHGRSIGFSIDWENGSSGTYDGTINDVGLMSGTSWLASDKRTPVASWNAKRPAECADAAVAPAPKPEVSASFKTFCESYASAAFQLSIQAAKHPECKLTGTRWSTNKKFHLDWCLGLNGNETAATAETAARSQGLTDCVALVKANQNASPPLPKGTLIGVWDTKTGDGQSYTLLILPQGDTLSVAVGAADKTLDGSMQASFFLEHKRMNFILTQPGIGATSRGSINLTGDDSFTGTMTKDGGGQTSWTGTRRK